MTHNTKTGLALVATLVITLLVGGCGRPTETINQDPFSKRLDSELFLKVSGAKEERRMVQYWPGTRTIKAIEVTYADGGLQVSQYRKNGKPSLLTEWYPLSSTQAGTAGDTALRVGEKGQLKRLIEFAEDGYTVLKASFYRVDGTRQAVGRFEADSQFHLLDYDVDGLTLTKQQVFERDGMPTFLLVRVGEPVRTVERKLADGKMESTAFAENGVRTMRSVTDPSSRFEDIDFYREDGRALKYTVYRHYIISALFYREDGSVDHYREFNYNYMTVIQYRPGVTPVFGSDASTAQPGEALRQIYKIVTVDGVESYKLDKVEEVNEAGKVMRRIWYSDSGEPKSVDYLDDSGAMKKSVALRQNGTVESVSDYVKTDANTTTVVKTEVDEAKNLRENVDSRLKQLVPLTDPRPLVGPPIQQPYYDYEGGFWP